MSGGTLDVSQRLPIGQARKLIAAILKDGQVAWWKHAEDEMEADDLDRPDVLNVLRAGQMYEEGEWQKTCWRYRVHTERIGVVVTFRSSDELAIVTAWRKKMRGQP